MLRQRTRYSKGNTGNHGHLEEVGKNKRELPKDLVDYYLKERFNIDLHTQKNRLGSAANPT